MAFLDDAPGGAAPLVDAAQLRARIEGSRARVAAAEARSREAKAALDGAVSTASSADRAVSVTVGPGGTLLDVSFGPSAQKLPLPTLARSVLGTYREATAEALANTRAIMSELLGEAAAPVLDAMRADVPTEEQP